MATIVPVNSAIVDALSKAESPEAPDIASAFRAAAKATAAETWGLLIQLFEMMLHASDMNKPLGPICTTSDGRRSMIPADLTEEQLAVIRPLLSAIDHTGFRARLGDVLWVRDHDAAAARIAAYAYQQLGIALETSDHSYDAAAQYERGLRIAKQIDRKGTQLREALDHLQQRVRSYSADHDRLRLDLLALLYDLRDGDPAQLGAIAMNAGGRFRAEQAPYLGRKAYDLAAKYFRRAGDASSAEAALIASAETYLQEADGYGEGMNQLGTHGAIQKAILAFKKIPSCRDRIPGLQRRLSEAGKEVLGSMQTVELPMDIRELVERAEKLISASTFEEAVFKLAIITSLNDPSELRTQVTRILAESPLHALFSTTVLDSAGRTTGVAPGALSGSDAEREAGMRHEMHRQAGLSRSLACGGYIMPSLQIINREHAVEEAEVAKLIAGHPLIPEGHETFFIRGIADGLKADFPSALLFLVPQIENSLRLMLHDAGVITTDLDSVGIEREWTLSKVLEHPALSEIVGAPMVYELADLFLGDWFGANFRNTLAHGLLSYPGASQPEAVYLWWVMLRLIVLSSPQFQAFIERQRGAD